MTVKRSTPETISSKTDLKGVLIACGIIILFVLFWHHALFQIDLFKNNWADIFGTFLALEFLYTGLFITCHDAMHGAVCSRYRKLNNLIGHICISAFAWFDYDRMYKKHWQHHNHTGIVDTDPDYHNGQSTGFFSWYSHFLWEYISKEQIIRMTVWVTILLLILSVPLGNILVYMLICGLCSSLRLFYFGTYIPHRPKVTDETMPWEKSRSANVNRWISFLCCYHFDYHWEHHRWPYVPWWDLWKYKKLRQNIPQE